MKNQIQPGVAAAFVVAVLVLIGLIVYVSNRGTEGPATTTTSKGTPPPMSPDQQIQKHMQDIQQRQGGATGGQ